MKEYGIKIAIISVIVIVNIILFVALINSVNSYIEKIKTGDIQKAEEIEQKDIEGAIKINFPEIFKMVVEFFTGSILVKSILLIIGILLLIIGIIVFRK